jgi:hypothetical protein
MASDIGEFLELLGDNDVTRLREAAVYGIPDQVTLGSILSYRLRFEAKFGSFYCQYPHSVRI